LSEEFNASRCWRAATEVGVGLVLRAVGVLELAEAPQCEALPEQVLIRSAEAADVGGEHGVARPGHRRVARHHHHRVVVVLDPAPVARACRCGQLPADAGDVLRRPARWVPSEEEVA
jgi:hypothetical protein